MQLQASVAARSEFEQQYKAATEQQACISAAAAADHTRAAALEASQLSSATEAARLSSATEAARLSSAKEAARLSAELHAASESVVVLEGSLADQRVCSRTFELQIQALESAAAASLHAADEANALRGSRPTSGSQTVPQQTTVDGSQTEAPSSDGTDADIVVDDNIRTDGGTRAMALEGQLSEVSRERDAAVTRFLGLRDQMKQLQDAHEKQLEVRLGAS